MKLSCERVTFYYSLVWLVQTWMISLVPCYPPPPECLVCVLWSLRNRCLCTFFKGLAGFCGFLDTSNFSFPSLSPDSLSLDLLYSITELPQLCPGCLYLDPSFEFFLQRFTLLTRRIKIQTQQTQSDLARLCVSLCLSRWAGEYCSVLFIRTGTFWK